MPNSTLIPKYHWTFVEIDNSVTTDTVSQATAQVSNVVMSGQGRIGNAIALNGSDNSFLSLGREIGQFGREDFTVACGIKLAPTTRRIELFGNRTSRSHGNFFCVRVTAEGQITAEIDEDSQGTNYIDLTSSAGFDDDVWHHLAVVRQGNTLKLYIDGKVVRTGSNGIANIANGNEFRLGNPNPGVTDNAAAPVAAFEDLRIYDCALTDSQIAALVPPLRKGEIELTLVDGTPRILTSDVADLGQPASPFEKLRLGSETGVTLYQNVNFSGTAQDVAADLPKLSETKLGAPPRSIKIWSTPGRPFTGQWAILAPNGQYLSLAYSPLSTSPCITATEQFAVVQQSDLQWLEIIPGSSPASTGIPINSRVTSKLFCVEEEAGFRRFSLVNQQRDRWLKFVLDNRIALKSFNGKYVRAADGGGSGVFADRDYPLSDELFNLVPVTNNRIALATVRKGLYVSAVNGGGGAVNAQIPKLDVWETFILEQLEGNKIALKTASKGLYVCAEGGGGRELVANRQKRDIWETFEQVNLGGFDWTANKDERAIFTSAIKVADHESRVGELMPGEVAFYEHAAYWGKAWVLYDSHPDFKTIQGFDNVVSSIRLGPDTGATLYVNPVYGTTTPGQNAEKDVEDIVEDVPDLATAQIGSDKLSSVKVWRNLSPKQANINFSITLSQDYKLIPGQEKLQEFSSYRTILKFLPEVKDVEVWATDATQIEVDGKYYEVSEDNSLKLTPNQMNRLMITSEAEGINTPGLKIHTNTMKNFERVVIFPDREVHRQIADLEEGALWNATIKVPDPNNPEILKEEKLVKPGISSAEEVQVVQNTMTNLMQTVSYVSASQDDENQLVDRKINADAIEKPCFLGFTNTARLNSTDPTSPTPIRVEETEITQEQFLAMMNGASAPLAQSWKNPWKRIKEAVSGAISVAVGVVKQVVHVIVKTVQRIGEGIGRIIEKVEDWVVDTAEKAGAFVEGLVQKIGVAAKQFVEYLRSVFNWQDILGTQSSIVNSVNKGLDDATKLAEAAKKVVTKYMDELDNTVQSKLNQIIDDLRSGQSNLEKSGPELPEALEWFLSKLTSGSSGSENSTVPPRSTTADATAAATALEKFNSDFERDFAETQSKLLARFNGLVGTLITFITNPYNPKLALIGILEVLRDLMGDFLSFIKKIAGYFLNAIGVAVGQFKNLINGKINIPFITGLFKLIGAGDLTLLNLTSLLIAIPVTVISKLVFNKLPFEIKIDENTKTEERYLSGLGWGVTALTVDAVNGLIAARLDGVPEELDGADEISAGGGLEVVSLLLSFISWLGSFPDSPDFPGGRPYDIADPKYNVTKTNHPSEYWQRVLWSWQSAALGYDIIVMAGSFVFAGTPVKQRLKRRNEASIVLGSAVAAVTLGLTIQSTAIDKPQQTTSDIVGVFADYVPLIPDLFSLLRLPIFTPKGGFVVVAILDVVCTTLAGTGFGGATLHEDLKAYKTA
ncbi:MAG: LamG-like jellyroll fold domain-containing protein [Elainellaceae cyanobacterium]